MGTCWRCPTAAFAEVKDGLQLPDRRRRGRPARSCARCLRLRDRARELLAAEAAEPRGHAARSTSCARGLRADYESYYARYGPINRFRDARGPAGSTPRAGEERMATHRAAARSSLLAAIRSAPLVLSLEAFDDDHPARDAGGAAAQSG